MSATNKCPCLNDKAVKELEGDPSNKVINAECTAVSEDQCPKIRSMKRAVNSQCWKIKPAGAKEAAPKKGNH